MSVVFQRSHFMASLERYRELLSLLANCPLYVAHLGLVCDRKSAEEFAELACDVLSVEQLLVVVARMVEEEIANTHDDALGSVLRGNNALSKLEHEFVKRNAGLWLRDTLGPVLRGIMDDVAFYEVDPSKVRSSLGLQAREEDVEAVCALGKESVLSLAKKILDAVCSDRSLNSMPQSMRVIAAKTHQSALERGVEDALAVAGGFLWLRVLSPALTSPASAGLLGDAPGAVLHENQRRRVLLCTKLIQGASNNVQFGKKEPHMIQFNEFVTSASGEIKNFLRRVCALEPERLASYSGPTAGVPVKELFGEVESLDKMSVTTLMSLHRLCVSHSEKFLASLSKKGLLGKQGTRLSKVLGQLGPPPPQEMNSSAGAAGSDETGASTSNAGSSAAAASGNDGFEGDSTGKPIYWVDSTMFVVARRLRSELISENCSMLIDMVLDAMREGRCNSRSYDVVFDATYFAPSVSLRVIFQVGSALYRSLPHDMRKNIRVGVVLHPDRVARTLVQFALAMSSEKAKKKLRLCFSWNDLDSIVPGASNGIPEESRGHVLESMSVVKINKAGKRQRRLVKLTPRSLLNIDPRGPRVQNERAIALIDKMVLRDDRNLVMYFVEPDQAKARDWNEQTVEQFAEKLIQKPGSGMFSRIASNVKKATVSEKDLLEREYEFSSSKQRDEFVLGILKLGLDVQKRARNNPLPHFFVINKTGSVGQNQIRIWLLTTDSILNLDTTLKRHSEIALASIVSVKADPDKHDAVLLHVLDREEPICVRTEWRDSLVTAISEVLPAASSRVDEASRINSMMEDFIVRPFGRTFVDAPESRSPRTRPDNSFAFSRSRSANELPLLASRSPRMADQARSSNDVPILLRRERSSGRAAAVASTITTGDDISPRGSPRGVGGSPRPGTKSQIKMNE